MMTREQFDHWIADLRSGRYKQGKRTLKRKTDDGFEYCCLGVLLSGTLGQVVPVATTKTDSGPLKLYDMVSDNLDAIFEDCDMSGLLSSRNDRGDSFEEIADYIETRVKEAGI